ncbi:MAG: DUF3124 domain-containing protein [Pseudomonadota bacterium]|nr:DUF3124 domain-containing protein [Pseudomonadota bacterium]
MPEPTAADRKKKVPIALSIVASAAVLAIILTMLYVGSRLETIEDQLSFRPPQPGTAAQPAQPAASSIGPAVYVPAYSHIYSRGGEAFLLEVTLSVRNTDPERSIRVDRVRYFDTQGQMIREYAEAPITLGPLETVSYLVEKRDTEGGSGANFIVEWSADREVNPPIVEAVMIGVDRSHNLSFTSRGQPIARP